jgi:hypothetical protein
MVIKCTMLRIWFRYIMLALLRWVGSRVTKLGRKILKDMRNGDAIKSLEASPAVIHD